MECKVKHILTYLRKAILATPWVENLLKVTQVRRDWRVDMILCLLCFIAETVNVE